MTRQKYQNELLLIKASVQPSIIKVIKGAKILPRGYKTWVQSQNKAQWLAACGHVSTSKQSLRYILSPRMNSSFITRNRYNQVPQLTQDTNGKVTNSQLDTTNESQEAKVSPFPAGDRKANINKLTQGHSNHKTEKKHKISTKEVPPWNGQ